MITREATLQDLPQIKNLISEHNLSLPNEGKLIVVESDGVIKAFANLRYVLMVEPLVSSTPIASNKLWEYIKEKSAKSKIKIIRSFVEKKNKALLLKTGFYEIFPEHTIMEINFYMKENEVLNEKHRL